jgi:tetratricopeptide (TPR) repeat protein
LAEKQTTPTTPGEAPPPEREAVQPEGEPPPPHPITDLPIVVRFEASRPYVAKAMAEAYHQVALADADMVAATRAFEEIRTSLLTEPDAFKTWRRFDEAIGAADANRLRPALISLRAWFREQLFDQQRKRLSKSFESDPETGWREWLQTYAEGLARWRPLLCRNLVDGPFPFPERFRKPYDFKSATRLILHERWAEVHQFFTFLAGHEFLHSQTRARLLVPAGQIHLYYFSPRDRAQKFFEQAEQLAPGLGLVLAVMGSYYGEQNDFAKSLSYLEQAMQAAPDEAEPYVFMGDLEEKQGNLEKASTWYQEAINKAIGERSGYSRLLRLYGRPEFIARYEAHIVPLAERAIAVDETGEYRTYLDIGDTYALSRRYDKAHEWYDKAIHLEPDRLDGYTQKGFVWLEEGESRYDAARTVFLKAIDVSPGLYDGYWGMGRLAERRSQWAEAAEWYAQALQRQPEFHSALRSRIGEMQWKMGDFAKAEAALLDALKHDRTNDTTVLDLADDYKKQGKPAEALRLLRQIREIKGDGSEADYQNRVGNVYYYQKEYEKAAQHYLNAIRSDDTEAVYFSNLAGAYRVLERWTDAREYLKKAYTLHGDRQKYESQLARVYDEEAQALERSLPTLADGLARLDETIARVRAESGQAQTMEPLSQQLTRLEQMRAFVMRYGTHALTFDPEDKPIRVRLAPDVLPLILNADQANLSEEFRGLIGAVRKRLRERYGLIVPGLDFSELDGPGTPSRSYRIEVRDERVADGQLETEEEGDPLESIVQIIERVLSSHLDKLCGHQETANLLEQCDTKECAEIREDLHKLSAFTRRLKAILKQGQAITNLAPIAAEVNRGALEGSSGGNTPRIEPSEPRLTPGITVLTLYLGKLRPRPPEDASLAQQFADLQKRLFHELGVIAPQITIVGSQSTNQIEFQLQINDELLPTDSGPTPVQFVAAELWRRADQLLTPDLVEYYLTRLRVNLPALVNTIRHYFSIEDLTQKLRYRLSCQSSIKNLPRVLEELISTASDVP